jgi:hypothetical protein
VVAKWSSLYSNPSDNYPSSEIGFTEFSNKLAICTIDLVNYRRLFRKNKISKSPQEMIFWFFAFLGTNIEIPTQLLNDEKISKYVEFYFLLLYSNLS